MSRFWSTKRVGQKAMEDGFRFLKDRSLRVTEVF